MKHELVQARDATGMVLRGQNTALCGYYRGYAMMTTMNSKNRCYDVAVWASRPGEDISAPAGRWIAQYAQEHPACLGGSCQMNRLLLVHIAMDKKREVTARSLIDFYKAVSGWLAAGGMATVCDRCGSPGETSLYYLRPGYNALCPRCLEQIGEFNRRRQAVPGNLPAGVAGAALFSLIGAALWVFINRLGYIAAICGLVMMVCSFIGYQKFGKKLDLPGIIASILVAALMGLVSQYLCIGLDIYEGFRDLGVTLPQALAAVPAFLLDPEPDLLRAYLPDLLMGYLFMALGSFSVVKSAVAAWKNGGAAVERVARGPAAPPPRD